MDLCQATSSSRPLPTDSQSVQERTSSQMERPPCSLWLMRLFTEMLTTSSRLPSVTLTTVFISLRRLRSSSQLTTLVVTNSALARSDSSLLTAKSAALVIMPAKLLKKDSAVSSMLQLLMLPMKPKKPLLVESSMIFSKDLLLLVPQAQLFSRIQKVKPQLLHFHTMLTPSSVPRPDIFQSLQEWTSNNQQLMAKPSLCAHQTKTSITESSPPWMTQLLTST